MSKSKGNVIDPIEIADGYGADILRLWLGINDYKDDIKLSKDSLDKTISVYKKIRNILFKYSLSIIPENFEFNREVLEKLEGLDNRRIYDEFRRVEAKIRGYMNEFEFFNAINTFVKFLNEYSG